MKKFYEEPELERIWFHAADIITSSNPDPEEADTLVDGEDCGGCGEWS